MICDIRAALDAHASPANAAASTRFFKTGKGEYGEGDVFLGVTVPQQRAIARRFSDTPIVDIEAMLADPVHEMRLTALLILVRRYEKGTQGERKAIVDFYLRHLDGIWSTAPLRTSWVRGCSLRKTTPCSTVWRVRENFGARG